LNLLIFLLFKYSPAYILPLTPIYRSPRIIINCCINLQKIHDLWVLKYLNINRLFKYYSIIYLHIIRLFVFGGYLNINRLFF